MSSIAVQFPKLGLNFNVTREAIVIGDFAIYWYAIIIAIGAVLAVIYALTNAKKYGIDPDKLVDVVIVALITGIIGARAYYVLFSLENYTSFWDMINIRDGGLAIYGGLIFGILGAFITSRFNKMKFIPALDIAVGGFFIGQSIGRWGNFVNQEAFGTNTDLPWGMFSIRTKEYLEEVGWDLFKQGIEVDPSKPVHPCFLYESILCLVGFIIILFYFKHRKFDGELSLFYAAWYGAGRGLIEGIRTDSLMIGNIRVSQLVSFLICIIAVALIVFFRIRISKKRKTDPDYMQLYVNTKESQKQFIGSDEKAIEDAEASLNEADLYLYKAQTNIDRLVTGDADKDFEGSETTENEEMSADLTDPETIIELTDKEIQLAYAKLMATSEFLERFELEDESCEETDTSVTEDTANSESDCSDKIEEFSQKIISGKEYSAELHDLLEAASKLVYGQNEEETEDEEEREEEIIDSVADEDEDDGTNSPNSSK